MLKYLTILLDDTSVSFCHAENPYTSRKLIPVDTLKKGIIFAMKENLTIQFVYPGYDLPEEYVSLINTIDHIDIETARHTLNSDIVVIDDIYQLNVYTRKANLDSIYLIRCSYEELLASEAAICEAIKTLFRINVIVKNVTGFSDADIDRYQHFLNNISNVVIDELNNGRNPQINLITDKLYLDTQNHCKAGVENITLAPNGCFYICPAFYYDENCNKNHTQSVGNIDTGLNIKNQQLYKLECAPICRICDAYQCRRCVWLNKHLTREVNTPSRQQCVMAHLERNTSRMVKDKIISPIFIEDIPEIDYLDPFDFITNKNH